MRTRILLALISSFTLISSQSQIPDNWNPLSKRQRPSRIKIDNRVLACINNHPISVMDVMKKMDSIFYRQYPHLMDSEIARYQFYKAQWHYFFDEMVNNELIFADAKDRKVEITSGDIRQEMESLYGPQIIKSIDKIGLTYDEAWKMTEKDIAVRRMISSILYLKGVQDASPEMLKAAFEDYKEKNKNPDIWKFNTLTFRGANAYEKSQMVHDLLEQLKKETGESFKALSLRLKDKIENFDQQDITISSLFDLKETEISKPHKEILNKLSLKSFSAPQKEISRIDKKPVYRIFFLEEHLAGQDLIFAEVEEKLKYEIVQTKMNHEITAYVSQLRERLGFSKSAMDSLVPEGFEPFQIQ